MIVGQEKKLRFELSYQYSIYHLPSIYQANYDAPVGNSFKLKTYLEVPELIGLQSGLLAASSI
jgi:hypothetical protein